MQRHCGVGVWDNLTCLKNYRKIQKVRVKGWDERLAGSRSETRDQAEAT